MSIRKSNNYYYIDTLGNLKLPSVTFILDSINKPALIRWAAKQAAKVALEAIGTGEQLTEAMIVEKAFFRKDSAADRGTAIHQAINRFFNKEPAKQILETLPEAIRGYFEGFLSFWESLAPKLLHSEVTVYSEKYGYAGTLDLIIELSNGAVWLCDFKTGGVYREAGLQMKSYKEATLEMKLVPKIDKTVAIQLNANGSFNLSSLDEPFEVFLAVIELWKWLKGV